MNIHSQIVLLVSTLLALLLSSCIKEDLADCVQGIDIRFYSKTQCATDTVYPEQIKDITVCVFDENGLLAKYQKNNSIGALQSYIDRVELESTGTYTVIAWAGLDENLYDIHIPTEMVSQKTDLLFRLKRVLQVASAMEDSRIYYGESPIVYLSDTDRQASVFETTAVNMLEITNRVSIRLEGINRADNYEVIISSNNGSMNIDGTNAEDEMVDFTPAYRFEDNVLEADFTLLKLDVDNTNTITVKDQTKNHIIYQGDLLRALILRSEEINPACDHNFNIRITTLNDGDAYSVAEIWVNDWLVHSYDTGL